MRGAPFPFPEAGGCPISAASRTAPEDEDGRDGHMEKTGFGRQDERRLQALEERLPFSFRDRVTALSSITHSSYLHEHRDESAFGVTDNERLEFLGDAVVDLAVGLRLMQAFPGAREGDLSRMRSEIVDERGLSQVAMEIGVGKLLRLGKGESRSGGGDRPSILADAMEAIIAAVFLEGGLDAVLPIVDRHFHSLIDRAGSGEADTDYKSMFQAWAQAQLKETPVYRVVSEEGPIHDRVYVVEAVAGERVMGRGSGRSKKEAAHEAARAALDACAHGAQEVPGGEGGGAGEAGALPGEADSAPAPDAARDYVKVRSSRAMAWTEGDASAAPPTAPERGEDGRRPSASGKKRLCSPSERKAGRPSGKKPWKSVGQRNGNRNRHK